MAYNVPDELIHIVNSLLFSVLHESLVSGVGYYVQLLHPSFGHVSCLSLFHVRCHLANYLAVMYTKQRDFPPSVSVHRVVPQAGCDRQRETV